MGLFGKSHVVKLKVEGMSCMHCSAKVTKALEDLDGVKKAVLDLENKTAEVHLKKEDSHTTEELAASVSQAGFTASIQ